MILNPSAGGGAASRIADRLGARLERRGVRFSVLRTEGPGHGTALAREAAVDGASTVLAVGGDGTVHEVANGLLTRADHPRLAVLPAGTGNDFHRMLGSLPTVDGAIELLERGTGARFEVGRARWAGGERFFVNLLGIGIDAEILRLRSAFRHLRGLTQYLAALAAALVRYRPLSIAVDDRGPRRTETMLTAACVGPSAGGGFRLSPDADPEDGRLDLLVVNRLTPMQVARYLPRIVRGTHAGLPVVTLERFRRLLVRSTIDAPFRFELDGELVEDPVRELRVEVLPSRLRVMRRVPASA